MIYKRIYLIDNNTDVYLDVYCRDKNQYFNSKAILIIPGGGYSSVVSAKEGEPVALSFLAYGFCSFVLNYSVGMQNSFPSQLIEASLAIKHIKDHADEYGIDPEKVFVAGFSAGGHLAGSLGILWHMPEIYQQIDMPYGYNKPTGMMLIYPVVSGIKEYSHKSSHCYLWGQNVPTDEMLEKSSLELHVDEKSAPLFVMHTSSDNIVDVKNALVLGTAYKEAGLNFEMHIYPEGPHGVALANEITYRGKPETVNKHTAKWLETAVEWTDSIK